jgi:Ca2+-binding EF-hand superfamily protein
MEARQVIVGAVLVLSSWSGSLTTAYAAEQDNSRQATVRDRQMLYREMDKDGDGVITRTEWRGSAQSFRTHDTNRDGVLSGSEIWVGRGRGSNGSDIDAEFTRADRNNDGVIAPSEWRIDPDVFDRLDRNNDGVLTRGELVGDIDEVEGQVPDRPTFAQMDRNNNGVITSGEWTLPNEEFRALDTDGDGVLTAREYRADRNMVDSPAYRAGRERGLADGRQAGREDKTINGGKWDLEGQRELETADAGYNGSVGLRSDYQAGYRSGFRTGYREGFGPR